MPRRKEDKSKLELIPHKWYRSITDRQYLDLGWGNYWFSDKSLVDRLGYATEERELNISYLRHYWGRHSDEIQIHMNLYRDLVTTMLYYRIAPRSERIDAGFVIMPVLSREQKLGLEGLISRTMLDMSGTLKDPYTVSRICEYVDEQSLTAPSAYMLYEGLPVYGFEFWKKKRRQFRE